MIRMNIDEAVKQACEKPTLLEALTDICIWESERVVRQARTNKQWETCFRVCLKEVMEKYGYKPKGGIMKFTIQCEIKDRWVPHFLSMLRYMEHLGRIGASRSSLYADGDGDFRPKFKWNPALSSEAKPADDRRGDRLYDAG